MNTSLEFYYILWKIVVSYAVHVICVNLCKWSYEHIFFLCFEVLKQIISVLIGHLASWLTRETNYSATNRHWFILLSKVHSGRDVMSCISFLLFTAGILHHEACKYWWVRHNWLVSAVGDWPGHQILKHNPKVHHLIKIVKFYPCPTLSHLTWLLLYSLQCLIFVDCGTSQSRCHYIEEYCRRAGLFLSFISYVYYIPSKDFGHPPPDPRVGSGDYCGAIRKSFGCVLSGGMRCYSSVHILFILIVTVSSSCLHSCSVGCCFKKKGLVVE